jgi:predicted nucleic acid-binding protein
VNRPAHDRPIPPRVYLDTSLIFAAIFRHSLNWAASDEFCRRLAERRSQVYFSQTVRLELSEAIRKLATMPGRTPPGIRDEFSLDQWEHSVFVRRRWFEFGVRQFDALVASFAEVFEVPFDSTIWLSSVAVMTDERLRSHDAVHVATARAYRVPALATGDDHFLRVRDLEVILVRDAVG